MKRITPQLRLPLIPKARAELAALIVKSSDELGASFEAFAYELNRVGLERPRGIPFYSALV